MLLNAVFVCQKEEAEKELSCDSSHVPDMLQLYFFTSVCRGTLWMFPGALGHNDFCVISGDEFV